MAKQKKRFVVLFAVASAISCLLGCHVNRDFGPPGAVSYTHLTLPTIYSV